MAGPEESVFKKDQSPSVKMKGSRGRQRGWLHNTVNELHAAKLDSRTWPR